MNKKGFTLAELLAVLAILAIIVLVAVPTFNKYVLNSKNEYYKTLENTIKTAGMEYMSENPMFLPQQIGYYSTINKNTLLASGIIEEVTDSEGYKCDTVNVVVKKNKNGEYTYETCLKCGNYKSDAAICTDTYPEWGTTDIDSSNDKTGPSVTDIYVSNKTTNSVTINAICIDEESGIKEYLYSIDGGKTYVSGGKNSSYKFDNLEENGKYSFKVKCISDNKLNSERESGGVTVLTASFTNPSIKQVQTSDGFPIAGFTFSPKRDIQITYNNYNIEEDDVKYFLRSTVSVETNVDVYECSGDLNTLNQNNCSSTSTRTMAANKWYKTNDIETISTFSTDTNPDNYTLYASIGDGKNLSGISNYIVTHIDTKEPTITFITNPKTLGKDTYNFKSNVNYTFGYSDGIVSCDPSDSLGTGSYNVTCTATGNNGLTSSTTFQVKHSYPARYDSCATTVPQTYTYTCNHSDGYCGLCRGCCNYECGWVPENNDWCTGCCYEICRGTRYVCAGGYVCDEPGSRLSGSTCYY